MPSLYTSVGDTYRGYRVSTARLTSDSRVPHGPYGQWTAASLEITVFVNNSRLRIQLDSERIILEIGSNVLDSGKEETFSPSNNLVCSTPCRGVVIP
jgi:hypothetical protein